MDSDGKMANIFQELKQKFESKEKKCPSCGAKISKTARICPECGDNFFFHTAEPKVWQVQLNAENCCSVILLLLIALAFLYLTFPIVKTIFLIIGVAVAVIILAGLIMFAQLVYRIRKIFDFQSE